MRSLRLDAAVKELPVAAIADASPAIRNVSSFVGLRIGRMGGVQYRLEEWRWQPIEGTADISVDSSARRQDSAGVSGERANPCL